MAKLIPSLKEAADILKAIYEVAIEAGRVEEAKKAQEAQRMLREANGQIDKLRNKVAWLTTLVHMRDAGETPDREHSFFWTKSGDGPYCPTCWLKHEEIVKLAPNDPLWGHNGTHRCPIHLTSITPSEKPAH
jgi:hypothetical protein